MVPNNLEQRISKSIDRLVKFLEIPINSTKSFYVVGGFIILTGIFVYKYSTRLSTTMIIIGATLFCAGFLLYLFNQFKKIWLNSELGNIYRVMIGALLSTLISLPSFCLAAHAVNRVTGLPPDNFTSSITFLSVIYLPYMTAFIGIILLIAYLSWLLSSAALLTVTCHFRGAILSMLISPEKAFKNDTISNKDITLLAGHCLSAMLLVGFLIMLMQLYSSHRENLQKMTSYIVVMLDYYERSHCSNVKEGDLVAFLKEGTISVAHLEPTDLTFTFEHRECKHHVSDN